jgi:hypothetical protein
MKPSYVALQKQIDELAARLGQKQRRQCLWIVVNEGDDRKPAMERAIAEWLREHPKAKARGVDDFDWIVWSVVKWERLDSPLPGPSSSSNFNVVADEAEEKAKKRFRRRLVYPKAGVY